MDINWNEVGSVAAAGAIGGGASLVYSVTIGVPPAINAIPWGLPAYVLLGSVAAVFGVYLIAKTDTRQVNHCLAFAMACGLAWAPIFDGASALVQKKRDQAVHEKVSGKLEEVKAAIAELENANDQTLSVASDSVVKKLSDLAATASPIRDRQVEASVYLSFAKAIRAYDKIEEKGPRVYANAIEELRTVQATTGFGSSRMIPATGMPGRFADDTESFMKAPLKKKGG